MERDGHLHQPDAGRSSPIHGKCVFNRRFYLPPLKLFKRSMIIRGKKRAYQHFFITIYARLRIPPSRVQLKMEIGPWMSLPFGVDVFNPNLDFIYLQKRICPLKLTECRCHSRDASFVSWELIGLFLRSGETIFVFADD